MKSRFKFTLLAMTITLTLNTSQAFAIAETADKSVTTKTDNNFKTEGEKTSYALGASLGVYMANSFQEQKKLGIELDKERFVTGVQEALNDRKKLSNEEINTILKAFEAQVTDKTKVRMEKEVKEAEDNEAAGKKYREKFAKEKGVKKTASGLLYHIEKPGTGQAPKDTDTVTVHYKGNLIDGTEFDNSYKRSEPTSFPLNGVIPGWQEGMKLLKKGGKITLVIPPDLAYGKEGVQNNIPGNSTLKFEVELLEVKSKPVSTEKAPSTTDTPAPK